LQDVPEEVLRLVDQINETLASYKPSTYGVDFMNSVNGYKLVELNSRPGVQHPSWSKTYTLFNTAILDMLVSAVNNTTYGTK
jgi:glutathione synthase/RimK-type ligase-like ATP-grasp enzyme